MAKMLLLLVVLALGSFIDFVEPRQRPNIQLSLTDKGLNYVNKVLVKNLVNEVQGLAIPSITIHKFGNKLDLARTKVSNLHLKSASFGISDDLLRLTLDMHQVIIGSAYRSRLLFLSGGGRFNAQLNGLTINQYLYIGHNVNGQPIAGNAGCTTTIQSSSYIFENSRFLSLFANMARGAFQLMVERKICDAISEGIEEKGKRILPTLYPEHHKATGLACTTISYPITQQPIIEQHYIDFLITGEVKSDCNPLDFSSPAQSAMTRTIPAQDKMLSIAVTDDFINVLLKHHFRAGGLVTHKFHARPKSNVTIQITSTPVVITSNGSSIISFQGTNNTNFKGNLVAIIQDKKVSLNITNLRAYTTQGLEESENIKANSSSVFEVIQSHLTKIQRKLNASLRHVIPLPLIDAMRLVNDEVIYDQGRIILQMDILV